VTDAALDSLSQPPHLETLILDGCNLTDEGLESLNGCQTLRFLSLRKTPVTGRFLQRLEGVPLERLNLANTGCDGAELRNLANLKSLKVLSLNHCPIDDAGTAAIAEIPSLEDLFLDQTQITDQTLVQLKDALSLRALSINSTGVTAQGLRELKDLPNLQLVKVHGTKVTRGDVDTLEAEIDSFAIMITSRSGD
jgi:Leucine-rich repeat (LRR) protein